MQATNNCVKVGLCEGLEVEKHVEQESESPGDCSTAAQIYLNLYQPESSDASVHWKEK